VSWALTGDGARLLMALHKEHRRCGWKLILLQLYRCQGLAHLPLFCPLTRPVSLPIPLILRPGLVYNPRETKRLQLTLKCRAVIAGGLPYFPQQIITLLQGK